MHNMKEHCNNNATKQNHMLEKQSTYNLNERVFVVTPIFRKQSSDTLGKILLKLMISEFAQ